MFKIRSRKKEKSFFRSAPRPQKRRNLQDTIINSGIVILSFLLVAFIFSFSNRQTQSGVPIEITFPDLTKTSINAVDIFEQNPIHNIQVEILNGCGLPGIAGKMSDFLRKNQLDVVRAENADHFNYDQTLIISRNENQDGLKLVAGAFGLELDNSSRIKHIPDEKLDVDVTVIIGSDYKSIKPLAVYFQ